MLTIKAVWKRNTRQPLPVKTSCDCCGADLTRTIIITQDDKVWGVDCYARAIGQPRTRLPELTAAEKLLKGFAHVRPGDDAYAGKVRSVVVAAPYVKIVGGRPQLHLHLKGADGKETAVLCRNLLFSREDVFFRPATGESGESALSTRLGRLTEEACAHQKRIEEYARAKFNIAPSVPYSDFSNSVGCTLPIDEVVEALRGSYV